MGNYFEILRGVCLILSSSQENKKKLSAAGAKFFRPNYGSRGQTLSKEKKANITIVQALVSAAGAKILGPKLQSHPYRKNQNHKSTGPTQAQKYKPEITIVPFRR